LASKSTIQTRNVINVHVRRSIVILSNLSFLVKLYLFVETDFLAAGRRNKANKQASNNKKTGALARDPNLISTCRNFENSANARAAAIRR
jgi:hypothetical protein